MATNYYDSFVRKLKEIFMMDHAELDFGIYRIMNQKRQDIQQFLERELLPQVTQILTSAGAGDTTAIKARMKEIEAQAASFGASPEGNPEYQQLKAKMEQTTDTAALQNDVFSHLVTFFSRYYDNGDFVSKRRYKDNTYAIPYNGEEVKLHWANADQYYIKSSEYFRDYTFVLPESRRKVHFVLKDATTEQNNNKAANNMERRFAIYAVENEPCYEQQGDELSIFFTYELMPKATKQEALLAEALATIKPVVPEAFMELLTTKAPTAKDANRTLLEKHLTDYTAKNSFDYFIHKDLGGFLHRELDFYIKNEVMLLDDLDAEHIQSQLIIIKAIKQVGDKIIRMLAQLENFQKRLWLKKKFVVQSDYCITLDRVPEELYADILANDRQREEWVRLFAIDEIKGDMMTEAYSAPLTEEFLRQNPFLVLDTAFFSSQFKHKLVSHLGDKGIDEQCNGLLINSENFQALELLQEKYTERVKCVYIDPPYNIDGDGFVYKDNFRDSTWLSMMNECLSKGKSLMAQESPIFISIDDKEQSNVKSLCDLIWGSENFYAQVIWQKRTSPDARYNLGAAHDFITVYAKDKLLFKGSINKLELSEERASQYKNPDNDPRGVWASVDITGQTGHATDGQFYKITTPSGKEMTPPQGRCWALSESTFNDLVADNRIWYGENGNARPRQKKFLTESEGANLWSWWPNSEVGHNQEATKELAAFFGDSGVFTNPKPVRLIKRIIALASKDQSLILDYFAGSGTTGEAVINQNRSNGNRKYILCEMAEYFKKVTKPRVQKVIYSPDWKDGKPVSRQGISQCFKYIRLEQYEDTLNNLELKTPQQVVANFEEGSHFKESYMLGYMLNTETRDSLLNLKMFENPFAMTLKTTKDNELVPTQVDMVETFNYLIGLNVETEDWYRQDNICVVTGRTHREGYRTLVIWRNCTEISNEELNQFFERMDFRTRDTEFDIIYVNGDNTLPNLKRDEDHWKVVLTEEEFAKRMFENE